jgi:hypothetical protein
MNIQIACLKDSLDHKEERIEKQQFPPKPRGPDLLVGSIRSATRTQILTALPSKGRVDRLVGAYFSVMDMGASKYSADFYCHCLVNLTFITQLYYTDLPLRKK